MQYDVIVVLAALRAPLIIISSSSLSLVRRMFTKVNGKTTVDILLVAPLISCRKLNSMDQISLIVAESIFLRFSPKRKGSPLLVLATIRDFPGSEIP